MTDPPCHFVRRAEAVERDPEPGLLRRFGAGNSKISLAEHFMDQGWVGAAHSHPHDQMAYVVSGRLRIRAGDLEFEVAQGDSFVVRGGVEHQATALEPSHVIDIFTPCRTY
jgi:quercetin dioxygenase-like cupin family protein